MRAAGPGLLGSREYRKDQCHAVTRKTPKLYYFECSVVKSQNCENAGRSEIGPYHCGLLGDASLPKQYDEITVRTKLRRICRGKSQMRKLMRRISPCRRQPEGAATRGADLPRCNVKRRRRRLQAPLRQKRRRRQAILSDSFAMPAVIFEYPATRSVNEIGISTARRPAFQVR